MYGPLPSTSPSVTLPAGHRDLYRAPARPRRARSNGLLRQSMSFNAGLDAGGVTAGLAPIQPVPRLPAAVFRQRLPAPGDPAARAFAVFLGLLIDITRPVLPI